MRYARRHAARQACDEGRVSVEKFQLTKIRTRCDELGFLDIVTAIVVLAILVYAATRQFPAYRNDTSIHRTVPASLNNPSGERLDHYLVRTGHAASRRDAREMVARGAVWLNGRRGIKGALVHPGDNVEVEAPLAVAAIEPEAEIPIDVLFEDPALIVVNKPGGIPCHPLRPGERGTVMNAVVARFPETAAIGDKPIEGGLIHRLDNGTSGALMIARTADAFATVRRAIRSGAIKRKYLALVSEI